MSRILRQRVTPLSYTTVCKKCNTVQKSPELMHNVAWSQTVFECLLVKENSTLLECAAKVHLLKLQDADHERDDDQPLITRAQ